MNARIRKREQAKEINSNRTVMLLEKWQQFKYKTAKEAKYKNQSMNKDTDSKINTELKN